MEQIISKKEVDELMKIEGEARGISIKGEAEFILKEKGEKGLKKLEDTMAKIGCPIKYGELNALGFYPLKYEAITTFVLKKVFNFKEEDFRKVGAFEAKLSLIIRMFMKYFLSLELMAKKTPVIWRKYYTVGNLTAQEFNKKEKYAILRIENFKLHPSHCRTLEGFFATIVQMVVKELVTCKETKCIFKGDEYHEFLLKW
jgi:hypothetical protein